VGDGRAHGASDRRREGTKSADVLPEAGAIVWASNIIAFALLYWELDAGGAAARAHRPPARNVDLAFPSR
jgi:hypothetical protein